MKRFCILLLVALVSQVAVFSQNFKIKGRVLSSYDNSAVIGATVMTPDGKANTMCDLNGDFSFSYLPSGTTELVCIMLGFENLTIPVGSSTNVDLGTIYMKEQRNAIDEVVITAASPMSVQKGDTTQFNAASFKTNPDADADALISKMPGVIIEDGKVEAQGEEIKKIYVDGELFFGTDPLEALKSLPADAIESIQIFDEISDQAKLTGIEDADPNKAINIVTKNKSNKNTILKVEGSAGVGTETPAEFKYLSGGNVSFFNKKNRLTVTGITNNVNVARFGQSENVDGDDVDSNGNVQGLVQGIKTVTGAGVNFSHKDKENDKIEFSGNYFFNKINNPIEKYSEKDYYAVDGEYDTKNINSLNLSETDNFFQKLFFRLKYNPNESNTIIFEPSITHYQSEYSGIGASATIKDGDSVNRVESYSVSDVRNVTFSGKLFYSYRFAKKGRNLSANFSYNLSNRVLDRTQQETMRDTYSTTTEEWTLTADEDLTNRRIYQETVSNFVNLKVSFTETISEKHRLVFSALANRTVGNTNKTNDKYDYSTQAYSIIDTAQYSLIDRDYTSLGLGLGYNLTLNKATLSMGVDVAYLNQFYDQTLPYDTETRAKFTDTRPYLTLRYKVNKNTFLRVFYRGQTVLPDLSYMQNVIDDEYTTSLKIGNPDLEKGYKHSLNTNLNISTPAKSTNLSVTLNADMIENVISSAVEVMPADTVIYTTEADRMSGTNGYVPIEGAFLTKRINLDRYIGAKAKVTYSFVAKPIKSNINFSVNYGYIRNPSYYYELNYANIHSAGFRIGLSSNISENVDFNISSNTVFNYTDNTYLANSSYLNQNLYLNSNFIFGSIVLNSDITWRYYLHQGSYYLCNIGIGKKFFERKTGELRLTVYDILNQNRNVMHYVRNTNVEIINTNTIGRYVLLKFAYRFNTMSAPRRNDAIAGGSNVREISVDQLKDGVVK